MSDSLWPHVLQHARVPRPSLSPRICLNSYPLDRWGHPAISFCVTPFSWSQFFPASGSFPMSWLFTSGGQIIGGSGSASFLPIYIQGWFPLGLTGFIFLPSKRLSRVFSSPTIWKHQFFGAQSSLWSSSHICTWLLVKPYFWLYRPLSARWCLCFLICCLGLS